VETDRSSGSDGEPCFRNVTVDIDIGKRKWNGGEHGAGTELCVDPVEPLILATADPDTCRKDGM
jgi:hypothetical protein